MTLDEAIKNTEEVADKNERLCKKIHPAMQLFDYGKIAERHRQLAEWLKELKWLREQTRWIPVNERLPEEDNCTGSGVQFSDDVLMSVLNIVDEEDFIDFGHTIDGEWYSIVEKKRIQNGFDVIAWMPLPQPYKGESEDEE